MSKVNDLVLYVRKDELNAVFHVCISSTLSVMS